MNYKLSDAEKLAYSALPRVLKRGIVISGHDNHKMRGYETVTIAAPITINGLRANMAVVVKQTKGNRYKLHRVLAPDGKPLILPQKANAEPKTAGRFTEGAYSSGGTAPAINSASEKTLTQPDAKVKHSVAGSENILQDNLERTQALKDTKERLRYFGKQVAVTKQTTADPKAVDALANRIVQNWGAEMDGEEIAGKLQAVDGAADEGLPSTGEEENIQ